MADPQMDTVQHPTLGTLTFPHDMSPADRNAAIERMESQSPAPQSGGFLDTVKDFGKGILKGALHTVSVGDDFAAHHLPAWVTTQPGQTPSLENSLRNVQHTQDLATPHNTAQSVGRGLEQMGEFLIPGAGEERLLGKGASLGAKMLVKGAGAAGINTLQGGSPVAGFAGGAGGAAVGAGIAKMAAPIAEKAMGITAKSRIAGKDIGQEILDRTTGVRPATIARQAGENIANDSALLNSNAASSSIPVDLAPARNTALRFLQTADQQSERTGYNEVQGLNDMLTTRPSGAVIASPATASDALAAKRGVGAYKGSWNPQSQHDLADKAVDAVYGDLSEGLKRSVPQYEELNGKIQTMIPVEKRAAATDLNENLLARSLSRFGAKTGALTPLLAGASLGGATHGGMGALIGAGAGLIGPELLASPTSLMTAARIANSSTLPKLIRPTIGAGLQLTRRSDQ